MMDILKKNKGFTVMELLISLSIFIVITLLVISNFRIGDKRSRLRLHAQEVASALRDAQNLALTATPLPDGYVPAAYGVHFAPNQNSYLIFAELSTPANYLYNEGVDIDIQVFSLGEDHYISAVNVPQVNNVTCQDVNPPNLDIAFTVPEALVYFNGVQPLGEGSETHPDYCGPYNPTWVELASRKIDNKIKVLTNWISGQVSISSFY